jgi:N-carbamoyl-L-amino-acid hydrolase
LTAEALDGPAWNGRSTRALLADAGFAAEAMIANRSPLPIAAFVELHIEQGERLAEAGIPIGVVEGIVGIRRYYVTFEGQANHAGTTGMARRRDALVMAAPFITAVRDLAVVHGIVGTIGRVEVHPGASNVIPGRVVLDVEIRSMDNGVLDTAQSELQAAAAKCGGRCAEGHHMPPVPADETLMQAIERAAAGLDLHYVRMPSGAGHDAMNMAEICPFAMIFVPSEHGISHAPEEFTKAENCVAGGRVLLGTLLDMDERL